MSYQVRLERPAQKALEDLPAEVRRRMVRKLRSLGDDPFRGAQKLRIEEGYRARVGDYRILFTVDQQTLTVYVWRLSHRREAYR